MGPSELLGEFIRAWREDWAKVSRVRLADDLGDRSQPRLRVTHHMVREWESGQYPQPYPLVHALCAWMADTGLSEPETKAFRATVDLAVLGQAWPERFPGAPVERAPELEQALVRLFAAECAHPHPLRFIELEAMRGRLTRALDPHSPRPLTSEETQRCGFALTYANAGLAHYHNCAGRFRLAAAICRRNRRWVEGYFGNGGLGGELSPLGLRIQEAVNLAYAYGPEECSRLVTLSDEALSRGMPYEASGAYFAALGCASNMGAPHVAGLLTRATPHLHAEQVLDPVGGGRRAHYALFWASLASGMMAEAERHLEACGGWEDDEAMAGVLWYGANGALSFKTGHPADALDSYERGFATASALGYQDQARRLERDIETCIHAEEGRARRPTRRRTAR